MEQHIGSKILYSQSTTPPYIPSCPETQFMDNSDINIEDQFADYQHKTWIDLDSQIAENNNLTSQDYTAILGPNIGHEWQQWHPQFWTELMTSHWLFTMQSTQLPELTPQRYAGLTGADMMRMAYQEFREYDPECGTLVWSMFSRHKDTYTVLPLAPTSSDTLPISMDEQVASLTISLKEMLKSVDVNDKFTSLNMSTPMQSSLHTPQNIPLPIQTEELDSCKVEPLPHFEELIGYSDESNHSSCEELSDSGRGSVLHSEASVGCIKDSNPVKPKRRRRRKGEPKVDPPRLWKFILELLQDPQNQRIIRWEDRNEGIFRVLDSTKVADLWGEMKNNPKMTYEKMARALRYSRREGHFMDLPVDSHHPKRLCFRFHDSHVPNQYAVLNKFQLNSIAE